MNTNNQAQRLNVFDGYKGLSIISILMYYFFQHILPGGYLAVNFFLLIAGFFNFRHFYIADQKGTPTRAITFYLKRLERLFFPMLAVILSTGTFILLFARNFMSNLRNMGLTSLLFINNYYQIINNQSYFVQAANPSPFTHLWYVSLLAQLILLTPLLIFLFYSWHRKPSITVNLLLIAAALSAFFLGYSYSENTDPTGIYYGLLTRAFAYLLGGALGLLFPAQLNPKPLKGKVMWIFNVVGFICIVSLYIMMKFMYGTQPFAYRFGMTLFTIVSAILVIVTIHPSSIWNKIISFPVFTFLGKRSLSYYLWYYPVYLIFAQAIRPLGLPFWPNMIVQLVALVVLSEINYQLFEIRKVSLPIGQDFNWRKTKYQLNFLRNHPNELVNIKIITGIYAVVFLLGSIGILAAPEAKDDTVNIVQQVIEQNQEIANQTQTEKSQSNKVVNNIDGLEQHEHLYANGLDVTFIGDSVLLASTESIKRVFPKAIISGEVGRQLYNSVSVVESLKNQDLLMSSVVVILGSNGTFTPGQIDDFINAMGPERDIFFVTATAVRSWVPDANHQLFAAAQRFGNVNIIDWASYSNDQPDWQLDDFGHLSETGSEELAKFIASEIFRQR